MTFGLGLAGNSCEEQEEHPTAMSSTQQQSTARHTKRTGFLGPKRIRESIVDFVDMFVISEILPDIAR